VNRLFTYIRVVLALAVIFVTVPLYANMAAIYTGNDINISRTLYTAPWEEEREADMKVTHIKEHARKNILVQDVNAPTVHHARVEARLLREKREITRHVKAAIDTGSVDHDTLKHIKLLNGVRTRISDHNSRHFLAELTHTLVSTGFLFDTPHTVLHAETLAGHRPDAQTLACTAPAAALPAPGSMKAKKKGHKNGSRDSCSRTLTDGVNLHTYALDTDKVDIFRLVLYRWEDGPFDSPAPRGAHIKFLSLSTAHAAGSTRIPRGTHTATHTLRTHATHIFGSHPHTNNNITLPAGGLI
jgi:hypothetical protein